MTICRATSLLLGIILVTGCGGAKAPPAYHLAGSVTFNGQPVPAGVINFDSALPHSSSMPGYATIKNGKFDTRTGGVGHAGGKMIVRVSGFDGLAQGELSQGNVLFPTVEMELDLPTKDHTHDFNLPVAK